MSNQGNRPVVNPKHPATESTRVFLSYSRKDTEFVDRLEKALTSRGIKVFIDRTEIEKGAHWWDRIRQLIRMSDTVVFVLSPDSVISDICQQEVEYAVEFGKRLLPVVCRQTDNQQVPAALVSINYIFFAENDSGSSDDEFESAFEQLYTALHTDLQWVREQTRLGELAQYWDDSGRSPDLLLHGKPLKLAISWLHSALNRMDEPALNLENPLHLFIQSSSRKRYGYSPFNWRSPIVALPLVLFLTALVTVGVTLLDWSSTLPMFDWLGLKENADFPPFIFTVAVVLFILYLTVSVRSRYLIARNVNFLGVWPSRWFALRAVIYSALCLAGFGVILFLVLQ